MRREEHKTDPPALVRFRKQHPLVFDWIAMAVYTAFVYGWFLRAHPAGRDFTILAGQGGAPEALQFAAGAMRDAFGARAAYYRLVNVALLYACVIAGYHLIIAALRCPPWLASLGAILFMANPVHTESVMNVCGAVDLLPALAALAGLACYMQGRRARKEWLYVLSLGLMAVTAVLVPGYAALPLCAAPLEALLPKGERRLWRPALVMLAIPFAFALHWSVLAERGFSVARMFGPLYFILYPIGFLPENAVLFHRWPAVGWLAAAAVFAILWLTMRKARRPAIPAAVAAMLLFRLAPGPRLVDPVHLIGGGQLLVPCLLFYIGLVALLWRMMEHPRWRRTLVGATTVAGMIFFGLQMAANFHWLEAGQRIRAFQQEVATFRAEWGDVELGVLPDYRCWQGAPLYLSESVRYDSPFTPEEAAGPVVPLLPLHVPESAGLQVEFAERGPDSVEVAISGAAMLKMAPHPYGLAREEGRLRFGRVRVKRLEDTEEGAALRLEAIEGKLPRFTLPARMYPEPYREGEQP